MARISSTPLAGDAAAFARSSAELDQLLVRLRKTILHPDLGRERLLRTSEYERARVGSNLEYARASLTGLEQEALGSVLASGRRAEMQADLSEKRELVELMMDRLQDFHKMAVDVDEDTSEGEDLLSELMLTPSESQASISTGGQQRDSTGSVDPPPTTYPEPPESPLPTQTEQTLRSRSSATPSSLQPPLPSSPSQPPSHATARAQLFASRQQQQQQQKNTTNAAHKATTATTEAILDQQAAEREDLAGKVLQMAQAMKKQQQTIHDSLESEKEVLSRATEGMERTGRGMEVARGRMGALQRMTEGKGWWGRVMLYVWVYGLMVGLVLLVFVMPKLRF